MKIAILSDTHDNLNMAQLARKTIAKAGIDTIIHCGDVIEPKILDYFIEFRMLLSYGNGDYPPELDQRLKRSRDDNLAGESLEIELDGKQLFVTHGHNLKLFHDAIQHGKYAYVFHGHTHRHRDEIMGSSRVINPGALGGKKVEPRGFVILDLKTDILERINFG